MSRTKSYTTITLWVSKERKKEMVEEVERIKKEKGLYCSMARFIMEAVEFYTHHLNAQRVKPDM